MILASEMKSMEGGDYSAGSPIINKYEPKINSISFIGQEVKCIGHGVPPFHWECSVIVCNTVVAELV